MSDPPGIGVEISGWAAFAQRRHRRMGLARRKDDALNDLGPAPLGDDALENANR